MSMYAIAICIVPEYNGTILIKSYVGNITNRRSWICGLIIDVAFIFILTSKYVSR